MDENALASLQGRLDESVTCGEMLKHIGVGDIIERYSMLFEILRRPQH